MTTSHAGLMSRMRASISSALDCPHGGEQGGQLTVYVARRNHIMVYQRQATDACASQRFSGIGAHPAQSGQKYMFACQPLETFIANENMRAFKLWWGSFHPDKFTQFRCPAHLMTIQASPPIWRKTT